MDRALFEVADAQRATNEKGELTFVAIKSQSCPDFIGISARASSVERKRGSVLLNPENRKRETALFTWFARTEGTTMHLPSPITITNIKAD